MKDGAKFQVHETDKEYERKILQAIQDEECKIQMQKDSASDLSSLPSQTDEKSVVADVKSKKVHTNELALV